jgi:hypothetical protein
VCEEHQRDAGREGGDGERRGWGGHIIWYKPVEKLEARESCKAFMGSTSSI